MYMFYCNVSDLCALLLLLLNKIKHTHTDGPACLSDGPTEIWSVAVWTGGCKFSYLHFAPSSITSIHRLVELTMRHETASQSIVICALPSRAIFCASVH